MKELPAKKATGVCNLTRPAMDALVRVEQALLSADAQSLTPLEFRTLMWARCSLAALYGIRTDEILAGGDDWSGPASGHDRFETLLFD